MFKVKIKLNLEYLDIQIESHIIIVLYLLIDLCSLQSGDNFQQW